MSSARRRWRGGTLEYSRRQPSRGMCGDRYNAAVERVCGVDSRDSREFGVDDWLWSRVGDPAASRGDQCIICLIVNGGASAAGACGGGGAATCASIPVTPARVRWPALAHSLTRSFSHACPYVSSPDLFSAAGTRAPSWLLLRRRRRLSTLLAGTTMISSSSAPVLVGTAPPCTLLIWV